MTLEEYTAILNFALACAGVAALIWGYFKWVHNRLVAPILRRIAAWWLPWSLAIKSLGQLPLALSAFSEFKGQLTDIQKQVATDDGKPIMDAIKQVQHGQFESHGMMNNFSARLENVSVQVNRVAANQRVSNDTDPRRATFECHADGRTECVNKTYLRWTGLQEKEVIGFGWLNAVHPDDQQRVRVEWHLAVNESRTCSMRFRMISTDADVFHVESTATPIPEGQAPPDRWMGVIFRLDQ